MWKEKTGMKKGLVMRYYVSLIHFSKQQVLRFKEINILHRSQSTASSLPLELPQIDPYLELIPKTLILLLTYVLFSFQVWETLLLPTYPLQI